MRPFLVLALFSVFFGCGEKAGPKVRVVLTQPAGVNAFSDTNVADIVFAVENVQQDGEILDQDSDGLPDFFAFPKSCGSTFPARCGFPVSPAGSIEMGDLPLNFLYTVEVFFRDVSGAALYRGSTSYSSDRATAEIPITLSVLP